MRLELSIVGLLSREKELTINQISKKLDESYPFVHRKVNELIDKKVVSKKTYGHSHVCSINWTDRTKALLYLHEVEKKEKYPKSIELKSKVKCAFIHDNKLHIITKNKIKHKQAKVISPKDFTLTEDIIQDHIILTGFNYFIEVLSKI